MGVGENSLVEVEKEVVSKVEQPKSVDGVVNPQYQIPITNYSYTTGSGKDLALEERRGKFLYKKVVEAEQRTKYLKNLNP